MVELRQISAGYGKQSVIEEISAGFEKGTLTALIGPNGCGKSTLLKAMLGILPLQRGEIVLDGQSTGAMTRTQIARKIAYLAQGKSTPDMTVEQMVLHGRFPHLHYPRQYSARDREIARWAMEQMGIDKLARTSMGALSGGMRQNAYIAMALTQETDYILLDEPTTYLDIAHQLELMKILRDLAGQGKGILTVMHDLPMSMTFSDRIVLLEGGRIAADGAPEEVYRREEIQRNFGVTLEQSQDGRSYRYLF